MKLLRSETMTLCDIYIQPEVSFETLSQLGEMSCVQILDLNKDRHLFKRSYVSEVCRCSEMERKLTYLKSELIKENIRIVPLGEEPKAMHPHDMDVHENLFDKWEHDISEMSINQVGLIKRHMELVEMFYVITSIGPLLGHVEGEPKTFLKEGTLNRNLDGGRLEILTGVVNRDRSHPFERMLWRVSRGNIYYKQASEDKIVKDPQKGQEVRKVAFLAICQGDVLGSILIKICNGFRVNLYPCPSDYNERERLSGDIFTRLMDLQQVLNTTKYHICKALCVIAKQWSVWIAQVRKSKAIYHALNCFNVDITKKCLIGQCWVPNKDLRAVQDILDKTSNEAGTNIPSFLSRTETSDIPPTFFRTNKFTHGFQALINAYSTSTYKELNPGLYTIITFPFLFSLMFADLGHGTIVLTFGLWMVINEKKLSTPKSDNEIWNIFFGGRYVITMLGAFSIYAGFVYNDFFSKSLNFESWHTHSAVTNLTPEMITAKPYLDLHPSVGRGYRFGIHPIWTFTSNQIMYENSIKMKLSIIIGIGHMILGILLSFRNNFYFKHYHAIFLECIPELLFLCCIFLYLVFMIYFKWFMYGPDGDGVNGVGCAPQLLLLFIDMVLMNESKPVGHECEAYLFPDQRKIQMILLAIALLCIPIMLLGIPVYKFMRQRRMNKFPKKMRPTFRQYRKESEELKEEKPTDEEETKPTVPFGDLMIHQGVHTIEFVLSTVSHTASYLRLWALSLAHAELSIMLWHMVLADLGLRQFTLFGGLSIFVSFAIWAVFTLVILVVMEGLSAFLHTLRLHWVEFMSKFYIGDGWPFTPFSFKAILDAADDKHSPEMAICQNPAG